MRIQNLIMQGLIAGAVLLIPADVFAEKGNGDQQNPAPEQRSQSDLKQENGNRNIPEQAGQNENELKSNVSKTNQKANKENTKESAKKFQGTRTNPGVKAHSSLQAKHGNQKERNIPQGQYNKNVPKSKPSNHMGETSKSIHTEKPIIKSLLHKDWVEMKYKKATNVDITSKSKEEYQTGIKEVRQIPFKLPLEKFPEQPNSKIIPVNAGQNSSNSPTTKDGGNGAVTIANFKASLGLPIIFSDGEKVFVYFSRLDLLRSQWVNAPPSRPPETAL